MTFDQWYKANQSNLSFADDLDGFYGVAKLAWDYQQEQIEKLRKENSNYGWMVNPDRMGG